jgi:ribose transport system permease protein
MDQISYVKRLLKNTGFTLIIPCFTLAVMLIACAVNGVPFWAAQSGFRAFLYSVTIVVFIAFALGINMSAGRFDFSIGAVSALTAVIGGRIALLLGLNSFTMLIAFILVGVVLGAISGGLYLLFNLPPMITSLGVTLAYEGLSFVLSGGRGVQIALRPELLRGAGVESMIALILAGLAVMYVLFNFTRFGFEYRAIQFGQKIAVETGLNERANAIICYIISGSLVAVVGYLRISFVGNQSPQLNLATSTTMFTALLPLFISGLMAKYCERNISIVLGCLTSAFITQGLLSTGVSIQARSLVSSFLMILILIYSTNGEKIKEWLAKQCVPVKQTQN